MSIPGKKRYCIFGCPELGAYMHSFPHPEKQLELFKTWVSIVGEKLTLTNPMKIYKNKKICHYHFTTDQKTSGHRLIFSAIPSLHLNGMVLSPSLSSQLEHNYCNPRVYMMDKNPQEDEATTSLDQPIDTEQESFIQPSASQMDVIEASSEHNTKEKYKVALKEIRKMKTELRRLSKKELKYKAQLTEAKEALSVKSALDIVAKNMANSEKLLTNMQHRLALKKPKGRRYNTEDKAMALSIYKTALKCLKLPSPRTLKMDDIKITPGINRVVFDKIKDAVEHLHIHERLCTLIFDDMLLSPHVEYNATSDELKPANHALVFMVKGIQNKFKQPVAYYFIQNLKTHDLKKIIKDVVRNLQSTGLKILCTVCDHGAINVCTINSLLKETKEKYLKKGIEWRHEFFEIHGQKIIPIYDVPHLIKGMRNNLITKNLKYVDSTENKEKIVKWNYFQMLYEADISCGELRYLQKIAEEHVNPIKIKKMPVKMAAQVFSHSVAVATNYLLAINKLPEECRQLIPMVLMIDQLFDSLNAGTFDIPNGKVYRGAIKLNSPHHELWRNAVRFLKTVKFIVEKMEGDKIRVLEATAPSVKYFIKTIEGMQTLWIILNEGYCLNSMLTRNFNQDPIVKLFGNVRSLGGRNLAPDRHAFEGAFKTLLLKNYSCS